MSATALAKRAVRSSIKITAAAADLVRRPPADATSVLIYHRVGAARSSEIDLPTPLFEQQVAWLAATGSVGTLDDLLAARAGDGSAPRAVLTFDDGTADWVDVVLPILVRHRVPALFYVATEFVEKGTAFPGEGTPISWEGLRELASVDLVTLGSHTHTHALLDRVDGPTAADELDRSIELLGEHTGVRATHFAYPKALLGSPAARAEVQARFATATIGLGRPNVAATCDPWALTRSPVQTSDGMAFFRRKADGGMRLEEDLRELLNRRRYAALTN